MDRYPFPMYDKYGNYVIPEFLSKFELVTATIGNETSRYVYIINLWKIFIEQYTFNPRHWRFINYVDTISNNMIIEVVNIKKLIELQLENGLYVHLGCLDRFSDG